MADEMVRYFAQLYQQIEFPTSNIVTEDASEIYWAGREVLLMYRGNHQILLQALQVFLATDVRCLALAGAAYVMQHAAYINGDSSDREGEVLARKLLRQAKENAPDCLELRLLEATLTDYENNPRKKRLALDHAAALPEAETSFFIAYAEMVYWDADNNLKRVEHWHNIAMERASTNVQGLAALNRLASIHLTHRNFEKAISLYQSVVSLDASDAWAWHNLSCICLDLKRFEEAAYYNRRALNIGQFGAAQSILQDLVKQWQGSRHDDPLEDVPRYHLIQAPPPRPKASEASKGLFGRLFGN